MILWKSGFGAFVTHRPFGESDESGRFTSIWKQSEVVPESNIAPSGSQAGLRKLLASGGDSFGELRAQADVTCWRLSSRHVVGATKS